MDLTLREARELLATIRADLPARDRIVRAAYDAGVSKQGIHRVTGLARTTIDRILTRTEQL